MNFINHNAGEELNVKRSLLGARIVEREFLRHPELEKRYGRIGREKCLQDANYHLSYLAQAISANEKALFRDYIGWAKVMLAKRGVPATDLKGLLESMREVIGQSLAPEFSQAVVEYISGALEQLSELPTEIPTFIPEGTPDADLARDYLNALLRGARDSANRLILDSVGQGAKVRDLYLRVFQRSQYEVGRLWQINRISVGQEHYCTAATQLIMSQLYPYIFGVEKTRGTLVATCVAGDMHELGPRMVSDFFEMDGWNTYYLGANAPTTSVVQTLVEHKATVLAVSATISYHIEAVEALIVAVRRAPECGGVKVLVGGYPFKVASDLWKSVGADGFAPDAESAVILANRLVGQSEIPV